jgi:ketosteroid isomerase-like protein
MSQENVDLNRRVIDAFNRRDLGGYLELTDPDVEFLPYEVKVQGGNLYGGHFGLRTWWEESFAVFPDLRGEISEMHDLGECVLVHGRILGQGAGSGAPIERPMWLVVEWRDKKMVWWSSFESEAEALEVASSRA